MDTHENYKLKLVHTEKKNLEIDFNALSSGERVLMALVASTYKSSTDGHFPGLLLLDEVDTSLHPSMVQNLLDVINDTFLLREVRVILVTHSPTTIALVPDDSIFVMTKTGENRIIKSSKNDALQILTEGFATLDEGIKLFDQISRKSLSVITEGQNTEYIQKALEYYGSDLKNEVEIITGVESKSGKNQLKTLFDFFVKVPHTNKVVFVWDPDVTSKLSSLNYTFPFIFESNNLNNKVKNGIENLFDKSLFKDEFYTKKPKPDGGYHKSLDKRKFKKHILTNGKKEDFQNFKPLIEKMKNILNS